MSKISPSTLKAQRDIIRRCENAEPGGVDKATIAQVAGVEPSALSKWIGEGQDQREMPWSAVRNMARVWGWDVVLGDDAAADGFTVERPPAAPAVDVLGASVSLVSEAADVPRAILDGIRSREGQQRALREIAEVREKLDGVEAAVLGARVSA